MTAFEASSVAEPENYKIVFASKNRGKIRELNALLEGMNVNLLSLHDYPDVPNIIEDGNTFLENALKKARVISEYTGGTIIADDSGLEVDYLEGAPGIHSARYAGAGATDERNICKLLEELEGVPTEKRRAAFRCALVLYRTDGTFETFEGKLEGSIATEPAGNEGFGYDPVFIVPEYGKTVAQLDPETKNKISHRAVAFAKLKKSLQEQVR
ncbi:MAG: XTP/dITP diphosphatase [Thermodesulfobacteriota bacterium]|nr:XTP/dITP diphosphatase [Thermodesulfobacteriota bacterium]